LHPTLGFLHFIDMDGSGFPDDLRDGVYYRWLHLVAADPTAFAALSEWHCNGLTFIPLSVHEIPSDGLLRFEMEALLLQYPEEDPEQETWGYQGWNGWGQSPRARREQLEESLNMPMLSLADS
jgi:hypothetical protein